MRKIYLFAFYLLLSVNVFSQTMAELVVPKYIGSKSASSTNNCRTCFAVCLRIDGLLANTSYDVKVGVGLVTDPATSYGAGNVWVGTAFQGTPNIQFGRQEMSILCNNDRISIFIFRKFFVRN